MIDPLDIVGSGSSFVVMSGTDIVGGPYTAYHLAVVAVPGIERRAIAAKCKPRACLRCQATFQSHGPHNRMCDPCRGDC
jgi:hypothetical protein